MIETNIRIVQPGTQFYLWTRQALLSGVHTPNDIIEQACSQLRRKHGLVAIPYSRRPSTLLVNTRNPISPIRLGADDWELEVTDAGQPAQQLTWEAPNGPDYLAALVEWIFIAQIESRTDFWRLDSPRIWHEDQPFMCQNGIAAYRRYEVGTIPIDNTGIGISVDVGTAFFSSQNLAYFFDPNVDSDEHKHREEIFRRLIGRQEGQKGTLLYDNGSSRIKCYFESAPFGMTCATTGAIFVKKQRYDSLLSYYHVEYPTLPVSESSLAVRVSFKGIEHPQPVAADRLQVRVTNDLVPESLKRVDKISPHERHRILSEQFWPLLEPNPLGYHAPGLCDEFWRPMPNQIIQFAIPPLSFGKQHKLASPDSGEIRSYQDHFQQRLRLMKRFGCFRVPPNITRVIYCAYPKSLGEKPAKQFALDLANNIFTLTGIDMQTQLVGYDSVNDAVEQLRDFKSVGMAVFVLNSEPRAYFEAAYQLSNWRIKRITDIVLSEHYEYLDKGVRDSRSGQFDLDAGQGRWKRFIDMNALDVIQQLDVIPYRIDQAGQYEAQLIIDVGQDKRHFALSLLIARQPQKSPSFHLISHVYPKTDKREGINPIALKEALIDLFSERPRKFDPIESLLVMRDGRIVEKEPDGIDDGISELARTGLLIEQVRLDWVEVHKDTLKYIRIWDVGNNGTIVNPLLGTAIQINRNTIIMVTTGIPALRQGTAEPVMIVSEGRCASLLDAAQSHFAGTQLNWSSPNVAQRLHIGLKRTDDDLRARDAQEIKRMR